MSSDDEYHSLTSGENVDFVSRRRKQIPWIRVLLGLLILQSAALWILLWFSSISIGANLKRASAKDIPVFDTDYCMPPPNTLILALTFYWLDIDEMQGWVPYITRAFNNHVRPDRHQHRYIIEFEDGEPQYVGEPRPEIDEAWDDILSGVSEELSCTWPTSILGVITAHVRCWRPWQLSTSIALASLLSQFCTKPTITQMEIIWWV
jgi:hypothetical protein